MGAINSLMNKIFPPSGQTAKLTEYFKTLNGYTPSFKTYQGGLYEMELTRSAIHAFATQCSKLKPVVQGSANKGLEKMLQTKPNPYMDTTKFLYRLATILRVNTTAFIIPLYDRDMETIIGYYPILPHKYEILQYNGEPWLRYYFANGETAAIELSRVGIMTQYQYRSDFFGDGHSALDSTLGLMDLQKQGMSDAINQNASIRFMAKIGTLTRPEDLVKERDRFSKDNLSSDNKSGVLLFDQKYTDIKQIESKPYLIDADQTKLINENVFNYMGTNENILQNKFDEDGWNAFYEGQIEPFAIQLSLVMSNMTFSDRQKGFNNEIMWTSNRMQYASNKTKLLVSTQLFDRGIFGVDDIAEIWNMPKTGQNSKYIRGEYLELDENGIPKKRDGSIPITMKEGTQNEPGTGI